jgi:hypothetical protein
VSKTISSVGAVARILIFGASAALLAGCWPARFVERPGIIGAVVSAADGKPVADATVRLARDAGFTVQPGSEVVTSRNGTFQLEPIHSWGLYSPLGDYLYAHGVVEVDAEGFEVARIDVGWPPTGRAKLSAGVIELRPSSLSD